MKQVLRARFRHGEAFAGTTEFASPEQFAGVGVDIRSDLYSLGLVLWEMVTGRVPFGGSPAEVIYRHQRAPSPLERLEDIPQPVALLIKTLLKKDPVQRFQNPTDLLQVMPAITDAIASGRRISRPGLQTELASDSRVPVHTSQTKRRPKKVSVARLPVTGSDLFGREEDIAFLDGAWTNPRINIVTIVAWAGVGKSTLVNHWLARMAAEHYGWAELVLGWSFYRQGTSGGTSSADADFAATLLAGTGAE
jgi:serine/threonine protein kinase